MIKLEKYTAEILENSRHLRLTWRVMNPDQTGFMGHMVIAKESEDSFWAGADAALALANETCDDLRTTDYEKLLEDEHAADYDQLAFRMGVKAVFNTWQPAIGTKDEEYIANTFATHHGYQYTFPKYLA